MDTTQTQRTEPTAPLPQLQEGGHQMQDILPEIKELAQKVGGMKRLAEILATLQQAQAE